MRENKIVKPNIESDNYGNRAKWSRCFITAVLFVAATVSSTASEQNAADLLGEFQQQLNLNDQQLAEFKDINIAFAQQLQQLREKEQSRFSKIRSFKEISKNKDQQLKSLLSEEQYQDYLTLQKQKKTELKKTLKAQRAANTNSQ